MTSIVAMNFSYCVGIHYRNEIQLSLSTTLDLFDIDLEEGDGIAYS